MPGRLPRTLDIIQRGIVDHLHIGVQLYISSRGRIIADLAIGESRIGVPMATDTLMLWLSAGKPITAIAIAQLWQRDKLDLDDPVARHIPAFAQNGKGGITIRHVLTHTGGFPHAAANWISLSWDQIIAQICADPIEHGWIPGRKAAYHIASGWFILGEIVRRLDGRPFEQYVRDEIFLPLGMKDSWIGMPPQQYHAYGNRIGIMHNTMRGHIRPQTWDDEANAVSCRPGANARGPIRELGRFYEMLLHRGRVPGTSHQIISAQAVEALTARHRTGMYDHTFRHIIDWGLGFIINSHLWNDPPYGFGPYASPRTFGHGGSQSSNAFADPERQLAVTFVFDGMPGEPAHASRNAAMVKAIYEDLGLV